MQRDARKTLIALEFKPNFADLSPVEIWGKTRFSAPVIAVLCLLPLLVFTATAQTKLTLQQVGSRTGPDYVPTYEAQQALVTGQVYTQPLWIADSYYLPIQDEKHYGLLLRTSSSLFQGMSPGDWVEAQGVVANRAGLPILVPQTVRRLRHTPPPTPLAVTASDLASFRYMGVLITTDNIVTDEDQNGGGDLLLIGARSQDLHIFLPRARRDSGPKLTGFRIGDRVRVTGIASQYCTLPPYDRFFQVLIASPSSVSVIERGWVVQPPFLLAALILAGSLALIWWFREQRMAGLRKQMRLLNSLGEQVIGATSSTEILRRLTVNLPALSDASGVGLYVHNRATKLLEGIHTANSAVDVVDPEAPASSMASGVAACFRGHTMLAVPDTRRSPHFRREEAAVSPRSVLFVPMFAQAELMGVLAIRHSSRFHYFSQGEQAAMQHLANQIATALKLQEQHSMREHLFRSEKLAAAGQLISDVANELRSPLQSIAELAAVLRSQNGEAPHPELESITTEATRANEIVGRLVSFGNVEQSQAEPLDLNAILSGLLKFRAPEWKVKGVEIKSQLAVKRAIVLGSPGQIEQVLMNLLVDAEKSAAEAREKVITVSSSLLAKRVLVEIAYPTRGPDIRGDSSDGDHTGSGALGLGVCRGIIESHGGEFRVVRTAPGQARFDIELPVIEARQAGTGASQLSEAIRQLTVLVVEPDGKVQRQLVELLGNRGDRVVPVSSAEEGLDIVDRLRFDMVICAVRLPGLNWVAFCERVRLRVGGFVLLTDAFNSDVGRAFRNSEGYVLTKPVDETELHRICRAVEDKTSLLIRE
ncbi:MAG TPA: GAF domain-containing protein [Bryobacteraceae bacterium]|nr:GAF domain-containing protein [Bryobacteraceae bacterium]